MGGKRTSDREPASKSVRNVERDDIQTIAQNKVGLPHQSTRDLILYQNEDVIQQICNQSVSIDGFRQSLAGNLLSKIQTVLGKSGISLNDFEEANIDEFAIRPVLKLATGVEAGAEFEVKWSLNNRINTTKVIPILLSYLPKKSASQLQQHTKRQNKNTPIFDLIYVGKPLCVYGIVDIQHSENEFDLKDGVFKVNILLNQSFNKLQFHLLEDRRLYVLGVMDSVQPTVVQAGAILLSNRAVLSTKQAI